VQAVLQTGWKMKSILLGALLVTSICSMSSGQTKSQSTKHVILPNIKLVRCMTSDCFQLLQNEPPRPGDIYPEHIDVAFLDRWCPFGLTARYNKAVSFDDLKDALEERYGKGTAKNWTDASVVVWEVESAHLVIQLDITDKRMAQIQHVEEGTRSVHYDDVSGKICPVR
jgi:hypothetical protein